MAYSGNGLKDTIALLLSRITQIEYILNRTTADALSQERYINNDRDRVNLYPISNEEKREEDQISSLEEQNSFNKEINI